MALKRDGSLVASGWTGWGLTNVPAGSDYVAADIELRLGVALKRDGSLAGWGTPALGIPGAPDYTTVAAGNDYTRVASGWNHGLALKRDGSPLAWGYSDWATTTVPAGNDFVSIATNTNTSVALRQDGTLVSWAWAGNERHTEVSVPNGAFTAVTVGPDYVIALKDTSPPSLAVPGTITATATSSAGATVAYNATAGDTVAGPLTPTCAPASGSVFAIGTTTVTCTATDAFANRGSAAFAVVVAKATCSVKLASRKVLVERKRGGPSKRYARVLLTASCTGAARVRLSGRVTLQGRRVDVTPVTATLAANRRRARSVKLPPRALAGLRQRARATVAVTLTATTGHGKAVARTAAARLSAVRR